MSECAVLWYCQTNIHTKGVTQMVNEKDYEWKVSAAGRVNIIGEHVDYCGGKIGRAHV